MKVKQLNWKLIFQSIVADVTILTSVWPNLKLAHSEMARRIITENFSNSPVRNENPAKAAQRKAMHHLCAYQTKRALYQKPVKAVQNDKWNVAAVRFTEEGVVTKVAGAVAKQLWPWNPQR